MALRLFYWRFFSDSGISGFVYFISLASFLIVIGGVIAAIVVTFSFDELRGAPRVFKEAFESVEYDLDQLIATFVELSGKARREGLLSLETDVQEVDEPFIKKRCPTSCRWNRS